MTLRFHHIVLYCRDTEVSRGWYERAGFPYARGYQGMHWFGLGDGEIMLHPGGSGESGNAPTVHVWSADLDAAFARVVEAGLEPFDHHSPGERLAAPVTRPWGDRVFELEDPDGHVWAFIDPGAG